jgi:hypothetical protein
VWFARVCCGVECEVEEGREWPRKASGMCELSGRFGWSVCVELWRVSSAAIDRDGAAVRASTFSIWMVCAWPIRE